MSRNRDDETTAYLRPTRPEPRRGAFSRIFSSVFRETREARAGYREISEVLNVLRAPLIVSIVGALVFAIPGQVHEFYRVIASEAGWDQETLSLLFRGEDGWQDGFRGQNVRVVAFFVMLHITGYILWYVGRTLTIADPRCRNCMVEGGADGFTARWAPRVFGALPAFGAAVGLFIAEATRGGDVVGPLYFWCGVALFLSLFRLWSAFRRTRGDRRLYQDTGRTSFSISVRLLLVGIVLAAIGYLITQPIFVTQLIGALAIICLFMIALVTFWAMMTWLYDRHAIPLFTTLILAALLFSALDLNDNHFIREIEVASDEQLDQIEDQFGGGAFGPMLPLTVDVAFEDWLASRADLDVYQDAGEPYPVYIVAAQGGGVYAAYQTAVFLARLQDACPTFSQHVFAISGVSGGAVGAAAFTAIALDHAENQDVVSLEAPCGVAPDSLGGRGFEERVDLMLRQDFLSPLINAFLFSDFSARFSPVPIPSFDRARALELTFEQAWLASLLPGEEFERNPLEEGLLSYWSEFDAAPAVFFNAMEAETGRRMVFSPIPELGGDLRSYAASVELRADDTAPDIRLSTAAIVSARFPYITPAASMALRRPDLDPDSAFPKVRLVDGGYFENSGLDTALDILSQLRDGEILRAIQDAARARAALERGEAPLALELQRAEPLLDEAAPRGLEDERRADLPEVDVRIIVFDLTEDRFRPAIYGLGELLSPVKAILNARVSRSGVAQTRARRQLEATCRYVFLGGALPPGADDEGDEDSVNRVCGFLDARDSAIWSVPLNDFEFDFQLGWILSDETFDRISDQLGDAVACSPTFGVDPLTAALGPNYVGDFSAPTDVEDDAVARHNGCVASFILGQLRAGAQGLRGAELAPEPELFGPRIEHAEAGAVDG